jgi:hypothetical protein
MPPPAVVPEIGASDRQGRACPAHPGRTSDFTGRHGERAGGPGRGTDKVSLPRGRIARVQVLAHGDDPEVGPGQTAVRVILSRAGRPEGPEADKEIVTTVRLGGPAPFVRLAGELPFLEWIEFRPHVPGRHGGYHPDAGPSMRFSPRDQSLAEQAGPGEPQEQLTPVMTRLGSADLAAVDTLIAASTQTSQAPPGKRSPSGASRHPSLPRSPRKTPGHQRVRGERDTFPETGNHGPHSLRPRLRWAGISQTGPLYRRRDKGQIVAEVRKTSERRRGQ